MSKWAQRAVAFSVVLVVLAVGIMPLRVAHADDAVKIRVEVTDSGFNGKADDFTLEVEQGQMVELTFVWTHKVYTFDEHIMVLEGYKMKSDKLTSANRQVTFKFVADKPGTFNFRCEIYCAAHGNLLRGYLKVKQRSGGSAVALTPTSLTLSLSSWSTDGQTFTAMAKLQDSKGEPVPKADVRFLLEGELAGTRGKMEIGTARTDVRGVALLDFKPALAVERYLVIARFDGMGIYAESQQDVEIQALGRPVAAYTMEPVGLDIIPPWAQPVAAGVSALPLAEKVIKDWPSLALALAVVAIWSTFAFILYQAFSIYRVRGRR